METSIILIVVFLLILLALGLSLKSLIVICQPSEVVIFSGPKKRPDALVGYRAIRGGRGLRMPIIEVVDRLDLTNMSVDVAVRGAYTRDGVPINILGVANVKIDGDPPGLDQAVVRLLGKSRDQIARLARDTLEGNLRGVLARLSPEQVNEDKESFARELIDEAEDDLGRLGLALDTLKIQTVADEVGYLDSIGRIQTAELIRLSRIGEADKKSDSDVKVAGDRLKTRVAQIEAALEVLKAETEKKVADALSSRPAKVAEVKAEIEPLVARSEASLKVQQARIEQVKIQLEADLIEPAKAYKVHMEEKAKAEVAIVRERGIATASGLSELATQWIEAGPHARDIFLLEKLQNLIQILVGTIQHAKIDQFTMVGTGQSNTASHVASFIEQTKAGGVDVGKLLSRIASGSQGIGALSQAQSEAKTPIGTPASIASTPTPHSPQIPSPPKSPLKPRSAP